MKIRIVTSLREFDALAPVWDEVTAASGQTSPFVSHDWFACCWRTAGPHRRREMWIFEDAAGPVAFVPLVREKASVRGLPVRVLRLLDSPDTPFTDFPVAGARDEIVSVLAETLRGHSDWDMLVCPRLLVDSPTHAALARSLDHGFGTRVAALERSPYLALTTGWEHFLARTAATFGQTCKAVDRRIRSAGTVTIEEHCKVEPDGGVFADLMQLYQQGKRAPAPAVATMPTVPRFFRELTHRASMNGWLHLWILRIDGQPVATEYQLGADGHLHTLRADIDPAFGAVSPEVHLRARIVEALFERGGIRHYDMGPDGGAETVQWASGFRETAALEVYAPTRYGSLLSTVETQLIPLARRVTAALRSRSA